MKNFINKYKYHIILGLAGGFAGFLYWRFIGCSSGSCPITSHWHTSAIYGVLFGILTGSIVNDEQIKKNKNEQI